MSHLTRIGLMGLTSAVFAAEGLASMAALQAADRRAAYIVHKEGQPGTLQLSPSGRVVTENFNYPEWAGAVVLGLLAERNTFYQTRLGADMAGPIVDTNIINFADLNWVALDEEGLEVELAADAEYRQGVIASALGIDRETGDIEGAIADHYIDRDNRGYTLDQIISKQDADEVFGNGEQQKQAEG